MQEKGGDGLSGCDWFADVVAWMKEQMIVMPDD